MYKEIVAFLAVFVTLFCIVLAFGVVDAQQTRANMEVCVQAGGNWYDGNCVLDKPR